MTVEGHFVGRLAGLGFEPARGASALENRALRGAVERVVAPEIARRLGELAAEEDGAFALGPAARVLWRGEAVGELTGGGPFAPRVRLFGEIGAAATRERAVRRLESFVADEAHRGLFALARLKSAVADGRLRGLARGLAYQLVEQCGVLDRKEVETHVRALSAGERRALRGLGVRFGAFSLYLPPLLTPEAQGVGAVFAELAEPGWRPAADRLTALPQPPPPHQALALRGLRAIAGLAAPVEALERLDALDSRGAAGGRRLAAARGGLDRTRLGACPGRADPARSRFRAGAKGGRRGTRPLASPRASGGGLAGASGRSSAGGPGPSKTSPPARA